MGTNLQATQTVGYNGYVFSVLMKTLGVEARSVSDSAGRTITHRVVTIRLQDIVQADTGTGQTLDLIRQTLEHPGGTLTFSDTGFGTLALPSGALTDLRWGPIPKVLSWEGLGSGNAARVTWQVEFAIKEGQANPTGPMEYNYGVSWSIDDSGYQKRSVKGHLTIPQTRRNINDRTLHANADSYRDKVYPPRITGFRRIPGDYELSEDKCTLSWSVTDVQEGPNFPPPGCIRAKASHRVESDNANLRGWTGNFDAEYELRYDLPPAIGTQHFVALVASRLKANKNQIGTKGGEKGRSSQMFLPTKLTMGQPDLYGKNIVTFGFTYTYRTDIETLLAASGLWTPVPNADWKKWSQSIASITEARGQAGLVFTNKDDYIIDLGDNNVLPLAGAKRLGSDKTDVKLQTLNQILHAMSFDPKDITPEKSWIEYKNVAEQTTIDDIAELKALAAQRIEQGSGVEGSGAAASAVMAGIVSASTTVKLAEWGYKALGSAKTVVQVRSKPSVYITLTGSAIRAKYPIKPPRLVLAKGAVPIMANREVNPFKTAVVGNWGTPLTWASWHMRYLVPGHEAEALMKLQGNPDFD